MQRHGEDTCLWRGGRDCPATLHNASSHRRINIGWLYHVSPPLVTWPPLLWTPLCPFLAHAATVSPTASEGRECWAHTNGVKEVQLFPESFINLPLQGTCRILIKAFVVAVSNSIFSSPSSIHTCVLLIVTALGCLSFIVWRDVGAELNPNLGCFYVPALEEHFLCAWVLNFFTWKVCWSLTYWNLARHNV